MRVHQLLPSFKLGDAMGQAALHLQLLLRRMGIFGEIFAGEVERGMASLAKPALMLQPTENDWVLYHHGIASSLASLVVRLRCHRGVVFHNISPARFYEDTGLAEPLRTGRAQLASLASQVELGIGVSEYNSRELIEAGFQNVHTVPLFIEPERFGADRADAKLLGRLRRPGTPTLLSVGRMVPHKKCEDVLSLHEALLRIEPDTRLFFVGGADLGSAYYRGLEERARRLVGVEFLGRLDHAQLVAAYRASTLFISMSEHEGFCVPLLEAMAAEIPALAFAAAAVPETLSGSGIAFTQKHYPALAELALELHADPQLRTQVLAGQGERLAALSAERAQESLQQALASVLPRKPRRRRNLRKRPRVAIVVQRYGDVSGGAEFHARAVALRLRDLWDLTVLTTCARDHLTWANEFASGLTHIDHIPVLRFPSERTREMTRFNRLSRSRFGRALDRMSEEHWIAEQGPLVPSLLEHLAAEKDTYDAVVFFTYLYAPTAWGLPLVADKALVVPTAHDEEPFKFGAYRDVFESPRALLCNTPEEAELIAKRYPRHAPIQIVGVGVEAEEGQPQRFRDRFNVQRPYLLYVGRLEAGKGVPELLKFHAALARRNPHAPELVLAGQPAMPLPTDGDGIRVLGRITEQEKSDGLAGALAAVVPSRYESLSLLALEAFAQGTPVLAREESAVLRGQVERSRAGALFRDGPTFQEGVRKLELAHPALREPARRFAAKHRWARVVSTYQEALDELRGRKS